MSTLSNEDITRMKDKPSLFPAIVLLYVCYILCMFFMPWVELGVVLSAFIVILTLIQIRMIFLNHYREVNRDLIQNYINQYLDKMNIFNDINILSFQLIYENNLRFSLPTDDDRLQELKLWHPFLKLKLQKFNENCIKIDERMQDIIQVARDNDILTLNRQGADIEFELTDRYENNPVDLEIRLREVNIESKINNTNSSEIMNQLKRESNILHNKLDKLRRRWNKRYRLRIIDF